MGRHLFLILVSHWVKVGGSTGDPVAGSFLEAAEFLALLVCNFLWPQAPISQAAGRAPLTMLLLQVDKLRANTLQATR